MGFGTDTTTLFSPECDLFQQNLKISSKTFENQLRKFNRIWIRSHSEGRRITSLCPQNTQRFLFRTWIIKWFCGRKSRSHSPAPQKYWAALFIHVWQAGTLTLLMTMPYSTEMLSCCSAVTSSFPGRSLPVHRLVQAIPIATGRLLRGLFACSPAPLTLLCTSGTDFYLRVDETERPVLLGNMTLLGHLGNATYPWCDQEVLVRSNISWHAWLVRYG